MKKYFLWILFFGIALNFARIMAAQDSNQPSSGIEITWPPPVTEVWGVGDVTGTAAVPDMAYYYLEYLALNPDLSEPDNAPWIPVTVAIEKPVTNGVLATLDTTQVPDGLYALRVVVNTLDGDTFSDQVTPIRVNNERYQQVREAILQEALANPTAQPTVEVTATPDDGRVLVYPTAPLTAVNVRRCDLVDNYRCAYIASLTTEGAEVLAISSNGSGWYQVRVKSGTVGWVSPTVISITGDVAGLPQVLPPAPLAPQPTAVPVTPLGVIPNGIAIDGNRAVCAQNFNVQVNVNNVSNTTSQPGSVSIQDVNVRTGEITFSTFGTYPALNPGGNFVVVIPMVVAVYPTESHELRTYTGGQTLSMRYMLVQGNCAAQGNPPPGQNIVIQNFGPNQCFVVLGNNVPIYDMPFGTIVRYLGASTRETRQVRIIDNSSAWYRIPVRGAGMVWVRRGNIKIQGDCSIRQ